MEYMQEEKTVADRWDSFVEDIWKQNFPSKEDAVKFIRLQLFKPMSDQLTELKAENERLKAERKIGVSELRKKLLAFQREHEENERVAYNDSLKSFYRARAIGIHDALCVIERMANTPSPIQSQGENPAK